MASNHFECHYCGRQDFKSAKGLTQHQNRSKCCRHQLVASVNGVQMPDFATEILNKEEETSSCTKCQKNTSHCHPTNDQHGNEEPDIDSFVGLVNDILESSFAPFQGQFNQTVCEKFQNTH